MFRILLASILAYLSHVDAKAQSPGAQAPVPIATASAKPTSTQTKSSTSEKAKTKISVNSEKSTPVATDTRKLKQRIDQGWTLLLGLGTGSISETGVQKIEGYEPHKGTAFTGHLLMGRYQAKTSYDFGLGWTYSKLKGREYYPGTNQQTNVIVGTQAGMLMGGARYRIKHFIEGGFSLSQWFGPDLSFSSLSSYPTTATFAGFDLVFLSVARDQIFRARLSANYDLTIPKRQIAIYSIGLDFGLPLLGNDQLIKNTTVVETKTVLKETQRTITTTVPVPVQVMQMTLDNRLVGFRKDGASVDPKSDPYLQRLGSALAGIQSKFSALSVRVTMSEFPKDPKRIELAEQRSILLANKFRMAGFPSTKIRFKGAVDQDLAPLGSGEAGLRVELQFFDATDRTSIETTIAGVNRQFALPDTCDGGECK